MGMTSIDVFKGSVRGAIAYLLDDGSDPDTDEERRAAALGFLSRFDGIGEARGEIEMTVTGADNGAYTIGRDAAGTAIRPCVYRDGWTGFVESIPHLPAVRHMMQDGTIGHLPERDVLASPETTEVALRDYYFADQWDAELRARGIDPVTGEPQR